MHQWECNTSKQQLGLLDFWVTATSPRWRALQRVTGQLICTKAAERKVAPSATGQKWRDWKRWANANTLSPESNSYFKQKIKFDSSLSAKLCIEYISLTSGTGSEFNMHISAACRSLFIWSQETSSITSSPDYGTFWRWRARKSSS